MLKTSFSLDPATSLANRAQIASYVVAWGQARTRTKAQAEAEANSKVRDWTKPIPMSEYLAMRQAFAKAFGEPEDKRVPSKEYVEKKLSELEGGEFRAEALSEIVSRDEVDPDVLLSIWDSKGHISVKKGSSTVAMPSGPEQLRLRLTVMCNAIRMLKLKHTQCREIKDVDADLFETYKEYLLGDYCYGLRTAESAGATIPPWTLVLSYEHAIRKYACELVTQEGLQLGAALKRAWKGARLKERHFITPLALYAKRPLPPPPGNWDNAGRGRGDEGRGKGGKGNKGPGKGKATATAKGSSRTPDDKPICFRGNSKAGCKKKDK